MEMNKRLDWCFSWLTTWEVLEHITQPSKFLHMVGHMVLRVLKPGGIFTGAAPNYGHPGTGQVRILAP